MTISEFFRRCYAPIKAYYNSINLDTLKKKADLADDLLNGTRSSIKFIQENTVFWMLGLIGTFLLGVEFYDARKKLRAGDQQAFNAWIMFLSFIGVSFASILFFTYAIPGAAVAIYFVDPHALLPIFYSFLVAVFLSKYINTYMKWCAEKATTRETWHAFFELAGGAGVLTGIMMDVFTPSIVTPFFSLLGIQFGIATIIITLAVLTAWANEILRDEPATPFETIANGFNRYVKDFKANKNLERYKTFAGTVCLTFVIADIAGWAPTALVIESFTITIPALVIGSFISIFLFSTLIRGAIGLGNFFANLWAEGSKGDLDATLLDNPSSNHSSRRQSKADVPLHDTGDPSSSFSKLTGSLDIPVERKEEAGTNNGPPTRNKSLGEISPPPVPDNFQLGAASPSQTDAQLLAAQGLMQGVTKPSAEASKQNTGIGLGLPPLPPLK